MLLAWLAVTACTLWTVVGFAAVVRTTRSRRRLEPAPRTTVQLPPVTILKPLCGADSGLRRNLETFFEQDYPSFELVFGVESEDDPAIDVVRALREEHPDVACKLIVHSTRAGINPKVRNLTGMMPFASHDLVLISDSNVRAPAHYVTEMVYTLLDGDEPAGLVTNLFAGTREDNLGSALENVQLNGFCAAGAALPTTLGDVLVIGKSMMFSRRVLDSLGGLDRVANVLAEDYVMGKMFQHAGYDVRIAPTVLENVTRGMTVKAFVLRHLRWGMLRWRLRPVAFGLEVLTSPLAVLPLAWATFGAWGLGWAAALLLLRDVGQWVALRGLSGAWVPALLSPIRELALLTVWLRAPFKRHVSWRGNHARLGAGTLLFEKAPSRA